jgi:hypothetical protein
VLSIKKLIPEISFQYKKSMSVAYEQSTILAVGARVRRLVLGTVLFMTLAVNVIFAICTLVNPTSIYAVLVLGLLLGGIHWLAEHTLVDAEEVVEAVLSNAHPALLRAPICIPYTWIVGTWLAWWFVTQLLFQVGIVYGHSLAGAIVIVALLIGVMALRIFASALEMRSLEAWLLFFVQLTTYVLFFFPSTDWAPQYIGALLVCARVVLFFVGIMLATFVEPPQWDVSLDEPRPVLEAEAEIRALMQNILNDPESGTTQQQKLRYERARAMLHAHARITQENRRVRATVAVSAWILVVPFTVVLFVYPCLLIALIYDAAKAKRTRNTSAQMVPPVDKQLPSSSPPLTFAADEQMQQTPVVSTLPKAVPVTKAPTLAVARAPSTESASRAVAASSPPLSAFDRNQLRPASNLLDRS